MGSSASKNIMSVEISPEQFAFLQKMIKEKEEEKKMTVEQLKARPQGENRYLDGDCPPAFVPCDPAVMNCPPDALGSHYVDKHGKRCFAREDVKEYYRKYTE